MTVEVYLCEKFQHGHERKAFGRFLQEMLDRFGKSSDLYLIIGEPEANTASMDMIVLTQRALVVLELKELTYAEGLGNSEIYLHGTEKGGWEYSLEGGSTYAMGSVAKDQNPYQQVKDHNFKLRDWLTAHSAFLPGGPWPKNEAIRRIYSWVVVSPGFSREKSGLDLPWQEIDRWFKVLSLDELAWEVGTAVNPDLELTSEQMVGLAKQLGAVRQENLQEFVPNYVPPPPRFSFFSRTPVSKRIVDRDGERRILADALNDGLVSIICVGGPGGIGKTHLATWVAGEAIRQDFTVLWVDCNEREVTQESILTAVADKMPDRYQAALIHDPDQKSSDKLETALAFLDRSLCLLVLNDYHRIRAPTALQDLFTNIIHKTSKIKVLLTTRVRPESLDDPEWTPGSVVELSLGGLPYDTVREYLSIENLDDTQLYELCERTSGNPYAISLFASILRHRPLVESLSALPLFTDERASQWANSLIETLDGEVRTLASRLSAIRTPLSLDLIERLFYGPHEKIYLLIRELIDRYILNETDSNQYQMHEYIREALISKAAGKDLQKAHQAAGGYFEKLGNQITDPGERIEAALQALYHYESAEHWTGILKVAAPVYDLLVARGDRDRSCSAAAQAVKAARALGDNEPIVAWLIKQIKRELDLLRLDIAQKHLNEAANLIPKSEQKLKGAAKPRWQGLEAQLWALQGRCHHLARDYARIADCFAKAVDLANQSGDRTVITDTLFRVAQIERLHGDYDNAKKHSEEAGNLAQKTGDQRLLAMCVSQLGMILKDRGEFEEARRLFLLARDKAREAGDLNGMEINNGQLGEILLRLGEYEEAGQIFRMLIDKAGELHKGLSIRIEMGRLVDCLIALNKLEEAEKYLVELQQRVEEAGDEIGRAFCLKRGGQLEQKRGDVKKGNELIQLGIRKLEESGNRVYIPDFEKALITGPVARQYGLWEKTEGLE